MKNRHLKLEPVALSEQLEAFFFREKISQNEIRALKKACEGFQNLSPTKWTGALQRPYSSYFGFLTALKAKKAAEQIINTGCHCTSISKLIDFGAGSLGASLGALDSGLRIDEITAIDRDLSASRWAAEEFSEFLPPKIHMRKNLPEFASIKDTYAFFANVLTEMGLSDSELKFSKLAKMERWIRKSTNSIFVFIEPATKVTNQNLLRWRDRLIADLQFHVILPCTHELTCPALQQDEWCHEEYAYSAPARFREIVEALGFRKEWLNFSMLVVSRDIPNRFQTTQARVVSSDLSSKGKCEKWLCAKGKRWRESKLLRGANEKNLGFFESGRGEILSESTHYEDPTE